MNKIRFWIIKCLDNEYTCWANLVMWQLGYQTLKETFGVDGNWKTQICRATNKGTSSYCGKCEKTGRFFNET